MKANAHMPPYSELRRVDGEEPAAAGHLTGGAAEMGQPTGEEDPEETSTRWELSTLLPAHLHEGPAKPIHEEAQSTAPHQQEQVVNLVPHGSVLTQTRHVLTVMTVLQRSACFYFVRLLFLSFSLLCWGRLHYIVKQSYLLGAETPSAGLVNHYEWKETVFFFNF